MKKLATKKQAFWVFFTFFGVLVVGVCLFVLYSSNKSSEPKLPDPRCQPPANALVGPDWKPPEGCPSFPGQKD